MGSFSSKKLWYSINLVQRQRAIYTQAKLNLCDEQRARLADILSSSATAPENHTDQMIFVVIDHKRHRNAANLVRQQLIPLLDYLEKE